MTGNFQVSSKLPDGRIFVVASETYAGFCESLESAVGVQESQALLQSMAQSLEDFLLLVHRQCRQSLMCSLGLL